MLWLRDNISKALVFTSGPQIDWFTNTKKTVKINIPYSEISTDPDDVRNTTVSIDELDRPFSVHDISKTISYLQRH